VKIHRALTFSDFLLDITAVDDWVGAHGVGGHPPTNPGLHPHRSPLCGGVLWGGWHIWSSPDGGSGGSQDGIFFSL